MGAPQAEHVDPVLTGIAIDYWREEFQAKFLLPDAPGDEVSGLYPKWERKAGFVVENDVLSADGEAAEDRFKVDYDTFSCIPHARRHPISAVTKTYDKMGGFVVPRERKATKLVMIKLQRRFEYLAALKLCNPTTYPTTNRFAQTDAWTKTTDVIGILRAAVDSCAIRANRILVGADIWPIIEDNEDILERIKYTQTGITTEQMVARLLRVQEVRVAEAQIYDKATDAYPYIWGDKICCAYVEEPGLDSVYFGATHQVDGGLQIRKYRLEQRGGGSDVIEGIWYYDQKVACNDCGAVITNASTGSGS
jgi:hypothetical protein